MTRRTVAALSALTLMTGYWSTMRGMIQQWAGDEDMGHGFAVPFVVLWVVWRERRRLEALVARPSAWGFALLGLGGALHVAAALGVGLFAASLSLLISAAGVLVCLGGLRWARALAFPLLLSLFMLPKLAFVYNEVTLPMQLLASRMAVAVLSLSRTPAVREGNILSIAGHWVLVAEACNGIRYLIPLSFLATIYAYLTDTEPWMRLWLLIASVPLAIVANALRVVAAASMPVQAQGAWHLGEGVAMFVLCLPTLTLIRRLTHAAYERLHV